MVMDAAARQDSTSAIPLIFFFSFRLLMMLVILPMLMSFMVRSFIALYDQIAFMKKHKQKMFALMLNSNNNFKEGQSDEERGEGEGEKEDGNNNTQDEEREKKEEKEGKEGKEEKDERFRQTSITMFSINENRNFYNPKKYIEQAEAEVETEIKMSMSFRTTDISRRTASKAIDNDHHHHNRTGISSIFPSFLFSGKKPTNSRPSPSTLNSKSGGLFHFRPPNPTKFHSSVPYIELWDMLALKEADDSALYSPTENQILLNLENYRLQMQYFSYLLYMKYRSIYFSSSFQELLLKKEKRKQRKEKEEEKVKKEQLLSMNLQESENDIDLGNNYYIPKIFGTQSGIDDPLGFFQDLKQLEEEEQQQQQHEEEEGNDQDQEEEPQSTYDFSESLYEQPLDPLSPLKKKKKFERRRSEQTKKRISVILTEIEEIDKQSTSATSLKSEKSETLKSERSTEQSEQDDEDDDKDQDNEMQNFLEKIENMLRINHSLNQVIQNIFIDFPKEDFGHIAAVSHHSSQTDNKNSKKNLSRNAFQKRFSIFNKSEDSSSGDQR
jgi:hypothetical protein